MDRTTTIIYIKTRFFMSTQLVEPQYQELLDKDIPHVSKDGVHVAVIAGESLGASVSRVCSNQAPH